MQRNLMSLVVVVVIFVMGFAAVQAQDEPTVALGGNDELGAFLVGADGMTLYTFANDEAGVSNCVDGCAANWPPLTVEEGVIPTLAEGISGELAVIARADGSRQVVYNGEPLYYWVNDAEAGDATGHLVNDVWFAAMMPTVGLAGNADLGEFLVGSNGMTLYTFANDEAGVSNCVDGCAANWPPLVVESADMIDAQPGLVGEFATIERADGTLQVTYNDQPLYYWINDAAPGDATGHLVNDVWFAALTTTINVVESEEFGAILTGANGMTLYTFANDEAGVSNCVDGCAANWPPLLVGVSVEPSSAAEAAGELGVIERADGSRQVTYNGAPLYYWVRDVLPGDTTGHNVNDVWFVALP
jgi:predicted lipoprotein with Yx(FWY)xxD motif